MNCYSNWRGNYISRGRWVILDSVHGCWYRCFLRGGRIGFLGHMAEVGGAWCELGLIACGGAWGRGILRGSLFVGLAGCAVCTWATLAAVAVAGAAAIAFTGFVATALVGLARLGLVMHWGLLRG